MINVYYQEEILEYKNQLNALTEINEEIHAYKTYINLNRYIFSLVSAIDYSRANTSNTKFIDKVQSFRAKYHHTLFKDVKFYRSDITYNTSDFIELCNQYKYIFYNDLIALKNINVEAFSAYSKFLFEEIKYCEMINNVDSEYIVSRIYYVFDKNIIDNISASKYKDGYEGSVENALINSKLADRIKMVPDDFVEEQGQTQDQGVDDNLLDIEEVEENPDNINYGEDRPLTD